jgi:hypothetical protein
LSRVSLGSLTNSTGSINKKLTYKKTNLIIMSENTKTHVLEIVKQLENPELIEWQDEENQTAFDYLNDALDIQYIVDGAKNYLGAKILVTFGGPNIWIDTQHNTVDGYWWGDNSSFSYKDELGLDNACRELFECC